jgi:hypothetical protein
MGYMFGTLLRVALGASLFACITGCGEKVPLKATNSSFEITYSGDLVVGSPIQFQSSTPEKRDVFWIFSDGTTSLEKAPLHTFYRVSHLGSQQVEDTVTLIVDNDIYHPNQKTFTLLPAVSRITRNFTWKGGRFVMHDSCCPGLTDHTLNDTIFAITRVDSFTVRAWGAELPYMADSNYFSNVRSAGRYNAIWVKYTKDTLYFRETSGDKKGWAENNYYYKF